MIEYLIQREKNILLMYGRTEFRFCQRTVINANSVWQSRNSVLPIPAFISWLKNEQQSLWNKRIIILLMFGGTEFRFCQRTVIVDKSLWQSRNSVLPIPAFISWIKKEQQSLWNKRIIILLMFGGSEFRFCQSTVIDANSVWQSRNSVLPIPAFISWLKNEQQSLWNKRIIILLMFGGTEFRFCQRIVIIKNSLWQSRNSRSQHK